MKRKVADQIIKKTFGVHRNASHGKEEEAGLKKKGGRTKTQLGPLVKKDAFVPSRLWGPIGGGVRFNKVTGGKK